MTDGDAALLEELRDMWMTYDPPPPGLVATMIAAVAAADLDAEWEMLTLVRDSRDEPAAQVRGLATSRILYFTAAEGSASGRRRMRIGWSGRSPHHRR